MDQMLQPGIVNGLGAGFGKGEGGGKCQVWVETYCIASRSFSNLLLHIEHGHKTHTPSGFSAWRIRFVDVVTQFRNEPVMGVVHLVHVFGQICEVY
jgi:hypothetical protein